MFSETPICARREGQLRAGRLQGCDQGVQAVGFDVTLTTKPVETGPQVHSSTRYRTHRSLVSVNAITSNSNSTSKSNSSSNSKSKSNGNGNGNGNGNL